jgi:outer membrane protein TolC
LKLIEAQAAAGLTDAGELEAAQDKVELIKAQLTGAPQQVWQARLTAAERKLKLITSRVGVGLSPASELDAAKAEVEVRRAELDAFSSKGPLPP